MAFTAEQLAANPLFVEALKAFAIQLRGRYDEQPRLARFLASHQRWLLSQAAFALHLEYDPDEPNSGLTTTRLREIVTTGRAASRNTVLNFLDQLVSYRFAKIAGDPARRPRRFEAADVTTKAMFGWMVANLAALDGLDGGNRARTLMEKPELFKLIQPQVARRSFDNIQWREPPRRVAMFLWTEAGGLVMDELIRRVRLSEEADGRFDIGRVDARLMAEQFMMSRTHLQRLFRKAIDENCLQWQDETKKSNLWFTADFLAEYCRWQAVKFSIVDQVFEEVSGKLASEGECDAAHRSAAVGEP
ncbi:hypothetical protein ACWKW9_06700 [Rhizobium daejeonense]